MRAVGELMAVAGVFAVLLLLVVLPWLGLRVGRPERFTWLRAAGEVAVTFAFLAAWPGCRSATPTRSISPARCC